MQGLVFSLCLTCAWSRLRAGLLLMGGWWAGPSSIKGTGYTDSRDQTFQFSEPSLDYQVWRGRMWFKQGPEAVCLLFACHDRGWHVA